jgi:glycosyltransferase involved in cell wall biosynthesis
MAGGALTKSNPLPKYTIRTCLVWLVPVISVLLGFVLFTPFLLSAALTPIEVPKLRDQLFGKRARKQLPCFRAPALIRLAFLWVIQAWWIVLWRAGIEAPAAVDDFAPGALLAETAGKAVPAGGLRGTAASVGRRPPSAPASLTAEETLSWTPQTLSVVLPCAGEGEFALNTVRSVFENTPPEVLHEIIVVDDGSEPALGKTHLQSTVRDKYRVKLIRHKKTVGLIGTKQDGGIAASGDIIVFFDCHVAPQPGWHSSFLRLVGENYKRVVVPMITDLDISTWTQRSFSAGMAKCYLTWDADFKWFNSDDPYVPVLSGGLLGISRRWWNMTRGYDEHMHGWGGENLDQSLRTWLCGGEIMMAQDAHVAHMWRVANDARTHPKYDVPANAAQKNRMRAAVAWFGEYAEKLRQFPELRADEKDPDGGPWYGDISNIVSVRTDLKCKSYSWFMHRFKHVYEDAGLIPRETFRLRSGPSSTSGLAVGECLTYMGQAGTSPDGKGVAQMMPCDERNERQRWHGANRDTAKADQSCCSSLRAWNTDQCINTAENGQVHTFVCDVSGATSGQAWQLTSDGRMMQQGYVSSSCIDADDGLKLQSCKSGHGIWIKEHPLEPIESRLYRQASFSGS